MSWIGVDLDGTLAKYESWVSETHIGEPIQKMVDRVKQWLADGQEVRIFTARVAHSNPRVIAAGECVITNSVQDWCEKHIGHRLPVTNVKDYAMIELWDDRAVQVHPNTGERVDGLS